MVYEVVFAPSQRFIWRSTKTNWGIAWCCAHSERCMYINVFFYETLCEMCVRSRHLTIIESPSRILQRNCSQALAKLFNFNFLNYFHLNAHWIYVLWDNHTSIYRAVAIADLWMCYWMCAESETDTAWERKSRSTAKRIKKKTNFFFVILFSHFFDNTICHG